jgi:glycosyltransferase involved in cell wall biosynthesis
MMSGTPVITTDWGAFTEYNIHGVTGYRCRTFEHFVWAAKNIDKIDTWKCNVWARKNFGYDKVGHMYEEYFQSLLNIHGKDGWYEPNDSRTELDWLKKEYPISINTL